MSTNDIDVAALRHAAASALPGPWHLQTGCSWRRIGTNFGDGDVLCPVKHPVDGWPDLGGDQASWRYIVAAHPGVVTALLDRLDDAERAREAASAALAETRAQLEEERARSAAAPVAWRIRYRSAPGMLGHYPWAYHDQRQRRENDPAYEVEALCVAPPLAIIAGEKS